VAFLEAEGLPTVAAALAWAHGPDVEPTSSIALRRLTIARGFLVDNGRKGTRSQPLT
jgi:hypothetical protein